MSKKLILVFVGVIFFSSFHFVLASLLINEIMYDVSGSDSVNSKSREWIEIYNPDSSAVSIDASKWRIYDGGENKTINNEINFSIPANSYVIFAGDKTTFLADNPNFSGTVYDTGITSLNNTGATLKLIDQNGNVVDSVTYTSSKGGAGDGNSLQLINGSWVAATPTPGAQNVVSSVSTTSSVTDNTTTTDTVVGGGLPVNYSNNNISSTTTINNQTETQNIKTQIIGKTLGFVGLPVSLNAMTFGTSGEKLFFGKYFWNFDDGDSKEISLTDSQPFTHIFYYPGNYVVSLDYYQNNYESDIAPDATSQINIKIIGADISISNVGDQKDFFVELTNNTDYNADISGWILASAQKSFTFPKNTIILSKQKLVLSPKITNFSIDDKNTLKLLDSDGNTVFYYINVPGIIATTGKITKTSRISSSDNSKSKIIAKTGADIPDVNNLIATALKNNIQDSNDPTPVLSAKAIIIFVSTFLFIGFSAFAVYFIRQKKNLSKESGSDFEILDE